MDVCTMRDVCVMYTRCMRDVQIDKVADRTDKTPAETLLYILYIPCTR